MPAQENHGLPGLVGSPVVGETPALGYKGGNSAVTEYLRKGRHGLAQPFERRFETDPGKQAQVDFAKFSVRFTDQSDVWRKVWRFFFVLGNSRWLWGWFRPNQKLETVMRCHILAFAACGGAPREVLYDRMKTAVLGENADEIVVKRDEAGQLTQVGGPKCCIVHERPESASFC